LVVNPAIHGCLAISTICALSAPSVNSLTFSDFSVTAVIIGLFSSCNVRMVAL
jgi:hypothetical protein